MMRNDRLFQVQTTFVTGGRLQQQINRWMNGLRFVRVARQNSGGKETRAAAVSLGGFAHVQTEGGKKRSFIKREQGLVAARTRRAVMKKRDGKQLRG